jgi:hypothetical protein
MLFTYNFLPREGWKDDSPRWGNPALTYIPRALKQWVISLAWPRSKPPQIKHKNIKGAGYIHFQPINVSIPRIHVSIQHNIHSSYYIYLSSVHVYAVFTYPCTLRISRIYSLYLYVKLRRVYVYLFSWISMYHVDASIHTVKAYKNQAPVVKHKEATSTPAVIIFRWAALARNTANHAHTYSMSAYRSTHGPL